MLRIIQKYRSALKIALICFITCCIVLLVQTKWNSLKTKMNGTGQSSPISSKSNNVPLGKHANVKKGPIPPKPKSNNSSTKNKADLQKNPKLHPPDSPLARLSNIMNKFTVNEISCSKLFNKDAEEQKKALQMTSYSGPTLPLNRFANIHCENFVKERGYITIPMTSEEDNFPIAYSIMVYKDLGQVERLFRAIYRPQNVYCFHADAKSPREFREGLKRIVSCFPNAIMSSRSVDVQWGRWTNLEGDLICMEDLLKRFPKWKYLINLTGQEFPLRTNLELVRILKALNRKNNIQAVFPFYADRIPKKKPSFPIQWIQTAVHIAAVRGFIEFLLYNEDALEITRLIRDAKHPDESLFGTLNYNPQLNAPGGYTGDPFNIVQLPYMTRLKHWSGLKHLRQPCESHYYVRWLCIFGIKDLPFLIHQPQMFVNKFYWNFQPFTYDCLEERIFDTAWRNFLQLKPPMDMQVYINWFK